MFLIRSAKRPDLEKILEIEKESYPKPWNEAAFICEFSKQSAGSNIFLSAEDAGSGVLAGYIVGNIIVDYVHILNLAVAPGFRKKGLAGLLLGRMESEAVKRKLGSMTLEVRETNTDAVNLYRKSGFEARGRREKVYDNREDELLMWKTL